MVHFGVISSKHLLLAFETSSRAHCVWMGHLRPRQLEPVTRHGRAWRAALEVADVCGVPVGGMSGDLLVALNLGPVSTPLEVTVVQQGCTAPWSLVFQGCRSLHPLATRSRGGSEGLPSSTASPSGSLPLPPRLRRQALHQVRPRNAGGSGLGGRDLCRQPGGSTCCTCFSTQRGTQVRHTLAGKLITVVTVTAPDLTFHTCALESGVPVVPKGGRARPSGSVVRVIV